MRDTWSIPYLGGDSPTSSRRTHWLCQDRSLIPTDLLGIGLSEGTAIVVTGDKFEVIGKWKVAIHDNTRPYQPWEKPYYILSLGDVYNMKTRKIEKYGIGSPVPPPALKKQ